jgi:hypothetical protein
MNNKEPTRYSMSTGLPHTENDEEVKKYPLGSIKKEESNEQAFLNFIQKAKESKKKYNERLEKENKDSS